MTTNLFTSTVIVRPMALVAGVARTRTMRGAARALPAMLLVSWPLAAVHAQTPCATTGTNQTCTNSVAISGGAGISDTATLTLTNTATGAIRGASFGVLADGTANVTNFGTIEASDEQGKGVFAGVTANVSNHGSGTVRYADQYSVSIEASELSQSPWQGPDGKADVVGGRGTIPLGPGFLPDKGKTGVAGGRRSAF